MHRFASVVAKSPLIQLDRAFDFVIPERLQDEILVGQSIKFNFGRSKTPLTGFVVDLMEVSEFAKNELLEIEDIDPLLRAETLAFARQVADRQCVALGEILSQSIPDHMKTVEKLDPIREGKPQIDLSVPVVPALGIRSAVLSSGRQLDFKSRLVPDWALLLAAEAVATFAAGGSSILIVPERSDLDVLTTLFEQLGLIDMCIVLKPGQKKSVRFQLTHQAASSPAAIVLGTRSAIYSPVQNLQFIGLHDDLDDSYREQGSPYTNLRELALMRAGENIKLVCTAPYRSIEIQRLVELGYMSDHKIDLPSPKISYTEPGLRMDQAGFQLVRESLENGPVLVLLPRKGDSAANFCGGCGQKLTCSCGGYFWQPTAERTVCRVCSKAHISCSNCQSRAVKKGRTGSSRQVSELGRAFPNVLITEATGTKKPTGLKQKNQIVVATPGSAPRLPGGYAAVLILDCDIWLARQTLNAQPLAIRDWMETVELLAPDGRAVLAGVPSELGNAIALRKFTALASTWLSEAKETGLPPAKRICTLEAEPKVLETAVSEARKAGATILRMDAKTNVALISFSYSQGVSVSKALRAVAAGAIARTVGNNKRRGLKVIMDDPGAL